MEIVTVGDAFSPTNNLLLSSNAKTSQTKPHKQLEPVRVDSGSL